MDVDVGEGHTWPEQIHRSGAHDQIRDVDPRGRLRVPNLGNVHELTTGTGVQRSGTPSKLVLTGVLPLSFGILLRSASSRN
jgi:hypothetical protein